MTSDLTARSSSSIQPEKRGRPATRVIVLAMALSAAGTLAQAQAEPDDAKTILKSMSDYVASQTTIALDFDSSIEVITPQLEKIQFTNSGGVLLSRPDKLRAHRIGGYAEVEMIFDGKTVSVLGKHINAYAQFDGPASVDDLIEALRAGHGVALPGADLLLSNSYEVLVDGVLEAKHIGRGVIDGVECEHLAFRNLDTDWQLWVEVGEHPIPRKLVITSKTMNSAPQYTLHVKDWKTDVEPAADAFAFIPPAGARRLEPDDLMDLDELPPGAPIGESK
ncbi:DUF2092 domain-containing protein [Thiocapsa rosea]|uniref:Uncharacterized protein n=1 Tax=Thiocapsa rosea TaxID=69360 RepID=A0A495V867_9GAMM|nr:DUF2092 domain-containing protein [Thiocapsa rosea]RKT45484.1 hypothetical protein BDD21_2943 [Thiocapsa rosea]